jgi:hypothetical protein
MDKWTEDHIASQRFSRSTPYGADPESGWKRLTVHQADSRPSWMRYGKGVANLQVEAVVDKDGVPLIQINASETALADAVCGPKRDFTKEVYLTIYGPAALELYEMLREAFEPRRDPVKETEAAR